jgi:hypothetical protein
MPKTLARPKLPPSRRLDGRIRGPVDAPALWASLPADERAAFLRRLPIDALTLEADDLDLYAALAFASSRGHRVVVAHGTRIDMPRRFVGCRPLRVAAGGGA